MNGLNKVMAIGRLGKDPDVRHLDSVKCVANFSIAISDNYTNNQGQKVEQTEWINIVCWNKLAEIAEKYLKKGGLVYVEGKLKTRSWDDNDGNKRYATDVLCQNFQMLGKKPEITQQEESNTIGNDGGTTDNLPF